VLTNLDGRSSDPDAEQHMRSSPAQPGHIDLRGLHSEDLRECGQWLSTNASQLEETYKVGRSDDVAVAEELAIYKDHS
jgi:hypothetical protein